MRILITVILMTTLAMTAAALANKTDDFVVQASIANHFEIASSQLAQKRSKRDDVQAFAKQMVKDHTAAGEKMKSALNKTKTQVQPVAGLTDDKHNKLMTKLEEASDDDFDKEYVSIQNDAHKEAVRLFEDYSNDGEDEALRKFAGETLPTLEEHYKMVKKLK